MRPRFLSVITSILVISIFSEEHPFYPCFQIYLAIGRVKTLKSLIFPVFVLLYPFLFLFFFLLSLSPLKNILAKLVLYFFLKENNSSCIHLAIVPPLYYNLLIHAFIIFFLILGLLCYFFLTS